MRETLTVVGAGVIGLTIARAAAIAGWSVRVLDPALSGRSANGAASWVAGGMLAPLSEGWPGEDELLSFGAESLTRWHGLADELGPGVVTSRGSVTLAFDSADAADLRTIAEWVGARGHAIEVLTRAEIRALEPSVSPSARLALHCPSEMAVDNRALLLALERSVLAEGVELVPTAVTDLAEITTDRVVVAGGWASARLVPTVPVRPVKGEILRLKLRPGSAAPPSRTVRATVHGRAVYLVPRPGGIVVGATQYEHGDDVAVTVAGVRDLLADAERVFPAVGDYEVAETAAGLRPGSPDNLPIIGRVDDRVVVATGHGRNGVLLAPLTADAVVAELSGAPLDVAACTSLHRFSRTLEGVQP